MAETIAVARFTAEVFALLEETFERVNGIYLDKGTSLFETLATVSAEEASRPVSPSCASIAAQVEHVRFYLEVLERYLRGETVGTVDWQASWRRTVVTAQEWETLQERLREAHRSVAATIRGIESWDGDDAIGASLAIVVHTAYHLGEIRPALCTVRH